MPRAPSTRALQAFRQTVLSGSVTGAAAALGRTQPAVSRLLKEVEAELGFALFDRVKGRLLLTPEGRLFFDELQRSFLGFERIAAVAADIRQGRKGTLRVATLPAAVTSFLPHALEAFARNHPGISLELLVRSSAAISRLVQAQACDLGIVEGSLASPALVVARRHDLRCAVIAPRRSPLGRRGPAALRDLEGQPFVALAPEHSALGAQLSAAFVREGIEVRTVATTNLTGTVSALVLRGLGLGVVDEPTAVAHVAAGGRAALLDAPVAMQLRFVQAAGFAANAPIRDLIAACEDALLSHKLS